MMYQRRPPDGAGIDPVLPNSDAYAVVYAWMVSELKLRGYALFIFASIFGFTRSFGQYRAGVKYLMDWTGVSKAQAYRVLSELEAQGILLSFKHWNGYEWTTAYAAFRNKAEAEAYREKMLLSGDPPTDDGNSTPVPPKGGTSGKGTGKRIRTSVSVPASEQKQKRKISFGKVSSGQKAVSECIPKQGKTVKPASLPAVKADSGKEPGNDLSDRMFRLWKSAGLIGENVSILSFMDEYRRAMQNVRQLRINYYDLEAAARNYVELLSVPPEKRWWSARMKFEDFTRKTVMRFLPDRFCLDSYLLSRRRGAPVSSCKSEVRVGLDF